jgi:histidyl-tRNA synthetase
VVDLSLPRGIRDIEPEEFELHRRVREAFEAVATEYNFKLMEPATLEHLATLRAKSGEEIDKEIYTFKDKAGRDVGLRFDLTVGITRYVCSRKDLKLPAKLAAFGGIWRYDEPQYGKYRWFHQWDLEVFGPPSVEADAEAIDASTAILTKLGLSATRVKIGDRRVVEDYIREGLGISDQAKVVDLMRALDKVEKKTGRELEEEYAAKGFGKDELSKLIEFGELHGTPRQVLDRAAELGLTSTGDLEKLVDILEARGAVGVEYSMSVVRGIDYYSGIVFEIVDERNPRLGSLCGGGRYDVLPRLFGRSDLSATGAAGGVERETLSMGPGGKVSPPLAFVVYASDDVYPDALRALKRIRNAGIRSETSWQGRSLGKQLEDASKSGAAWSVIIGRAEVAGKVVTLRDMKDRSERKVPLEKAVSEMAA